MRERRPRRRRGNSMRAGKKSWVVVIACVVLAGCAMGPRYKRPETNAPGGFRGESSAATNSLGELPWWEVFQDERLRELVRTALTNNYDVRIAVTRVQQAQALVAQARAGLFPQVNYGAE